MSIINKTVNLRLRTSKAASKNINKKKYTFSKKTLQPNLVSNSVSSIEAKVPALEGLDRLARLSAFAQDYLSDPSMATTPCPWLVERFQEELFSVIKMNRRG